MLGPARSSAGSTLLSGTLAAGETKSVTASGKTSIILGAPSAVHVTIDHQPVVLPAGYQTPFTSHWCRLPPETPPCLGGARPSRTVPDRQREGAGQVKASSRNAYTSASSLQAS